MNNKGNNKNVPTCAQILCANDKHFRAAIKIKEKSNIRYGGKNVRA